MKTALWRIRNAITGFSYRQILKRIFFLIDPETIHDIKLGLVKLMERDGFSSISEAVGKDCNKEA